MAPQPRALNLTENLQTQQLISDLFPLLSHLLFFSPVSFS